MIDNRISEIRLKHALQLLGVEHPRYMLVDVDTGEDLREAKDFEVKHVFHTANFSGTSMLGPRKVTLRKLSAGGVFHG